MQKSRNYLKGSYSVYHNGNQKSRQIEERVMEIAEYIVEHGATVRQTAKQFGVSKSTVHTVVTKWNGLCGA